MAKLHLGCGRSPMDGWINLDRKALPGVDIVFDLETCGPDNPLPLEDNSIDEFFASHLLEHITNTLPMMQELWRVAKNDAVFCIKTPYGSSDGAWEDPTHVRPYFIDSFNYFGQPYYWLADYGYRGDWLNYQIDLVLPDSELRFEEDLAVVKRAVMRERNIVNELAAYMRAVKPAREPKPEFRTNPWVRFLFHITPEAAAPPTDPNITAEDTAAAAMVLQRVQDEEALTSAMALKRALGPE